VSYTDDNDITIESYDDQLDEFEHDTFASGSFTQTSSISTLAPVAGNFQGNSTDAMVPKSAAGTDFVYRMDRGTNVFSIVSPWCNASITMENSAGNTISGSPFAITAGNSLDVTTNNTTANGLPNNDVIIIEESGSDCPVLITHHTTSNQDSFVMYPANTEWYGVGSSSVEIAAIEDNTSITVYRSGNTSTTHTLDRGDELSINDSGSDGSDPAQRIVADKPVGVKSIADSDGAESTTFLPPEEMDFTYYIPQNVQYIAIATIEGESTTVNLWEDGTDCGNGTADETSTVTPNDTYPGKIYFGDTAEGLEYDAGACLVSNNPIYVYYEYEEQDDETNLWSMKQNRQYISPAPSYSVSSESTGTWRLGQSSPSQWNRRRSITVTNTSTTNLTEYQMRVDISGYSDIYTNSQSDGGDLRIAGSTGDGTDNETYWLEYYNDTDEEGTIWIQFPTINASSSATLYLYYAHTPSSSSQTTTGNEISVFSYSNLKEIFYVVDSIADDNILDVISFVDNNQVSANGANTSFDKGDIITLPSGVRPTSMMSVKGPIHANFNENTTDSIIPISYSGKLFVYNVGRNNDVFSFYAPFETASVQIQESSSTGYTTLQTVSVPAGKSLRIAQDITNNRAFKIISTKDILVFHSNNTSDSKILYPTHLAKEQDTSVYSTQYELYGIGSNTMRLAAANNNTNITIYKSDGTSSTTTLNTSNNFVYSESGGGSQGNSMGYHIIADGPIGATSYADGDGGETTTFISQKEFSKTYALSSPTQYISIVTRDASVTCRVYDAAGTEITTGTMDNIPPQTSGTNTMPYPNRIHIGGDDTSDPAYFDAGYHMQCDEPVYAYFEHHLNSTITDETSLLTWPQVRKYVDTPPVIDDPDDVDEQGVYYESGFDSATTGSDPEAYFEYIVDVSSDTYGQHVFWNKFQWIEILNNRSTGGGVIQTTVQLAYADSTPNCTSATYSTFEELQFKTLSTSTDTTKDYVDIITNEKEITIPDKYSDNECIKFRIYLRTGNDAYSPQINSTSILYKLPSLLEDQISTPNIMIAGNINPDTDDRVRILKVINPIAGLVGSDSYLTYEGVSNASTFINADFEFTELDGTIPANINPQFDFPAFPATTPQNASTTSILDNTQSIAVYFTHRRISGNSETIDMSFSTDITNAGGPLNSRDFDLIVSN